MSNRSIFMGNFYNRDWWTLMKCYLWILVNTDQWQTPVQCRHSHQLHTPGLHNLQVHNKRAKRLYWKLSVWKRTCDMQHVHDSIFIDAWKQLSTRDLPVCCESSGPESPLVTWPHREQFPAKIHQHVVSISQGFVTLWKKTTFNDKWTEIFYALSLS